MSSKALVSTTVMAGGDPRRPADIVKYVAPRRPDADAGDPNALALLASVLGALGLFLKVRVASWGGLFVTLAAFTTTKSAELEFKTMMTSFSFSLMGIVTPHLQQWKR